MALDSDTMVMMHFNTSPTADEKGNTFVSSGSPILKIGHFRSAAYLDSSSSIYMNNDLDILSSAFTIDFWLKFDTASPDTAISYLLAFGSSNEEKLFQFSLKLTNGNGMIALVDSTILLHDQVLTHEDLAALGTNWFHMAFVYDPTGNGGSLPKLTCYVNGTKTKDLIGDGIGNTDFEALLTEYSNASLTAHYIDEFRVSSTVRWTSDFTPPTTEYGLDDSSYINYQYTKALLHFNTDAITDEVGDTNMWGIDGTISLGTNAKYGSNALQFVNNGGYIKNTVPIVFGESNFVIDMWVYIDSSFDSRDDITIFDLKNDNNNSMILMKATKNGELFIDPTASNQATHTSSIGKDTWAHVAFKYNAYTNNISVYINDIQKPIGVGHASSVRFMTPSYRLWTNWTLVIGNASFIGAIDEVRVMAGPTMSEIASYSTNLQTTEYNVSTNEFVVTEDENTISTLMNKNTNRLVSYDDCGNKWVQYGGQLAVETVNSVSSDTIIVNTASHPYNYLKTSSSTTFNLGTGNFTIEFFAQASVNDANEFGTLCELYNTTSSETIVLEATKVTNSVPETHAILSLSVNGTYASPNTNTSNYIYSNLVHIALEYNSTTHTLYGFVNGNNTLSMTNITFTDTEHWAVALFNSYSAPTITKSFIGKMDQFRISIGTNKYASDNTAFTAPTRTGKKFIVDGRSAPPDYPVNAVTQIPLRL